MGPLYALVLLTWALVRSVAASLLGLRRGLPDFLRSYAGDHVAPLNARERDMVQRFGGCIACGLCDGGEGEAMARSGGTYRGVMDLMLASSRSMPDYDAAVRSFDSIGDARLAELEARCPARVPMREVAAFVRAKATSTAARSGPKR
jgi:hypothetical protein